MPTPHPETGTEYIEIADFSPGIHSDLHATVGPRYTAADDAAGGLPGNGLARVEGTERCHADKTGALVPLPRADPTGMRDTIYPALPFNGLRPYRYLLDAQVGNALIDPTEVEVNPHMQPSRQLLQIVWGMYLNPES